MIVTVYNQHPDYDLIVDPDAMNWIGFKQSDPKYRKEIKRFSTVTFVPGRIYRSFGTGRKTSAGFLSVMCPPGIEFVYLGIYDAQAHGSIPASEILLFEVLVNNYAYQPSDDYALMRLCYTVLDNDTLCVQTRSQAVRLIEV